MDYKRRSEIEIMTTRPNAHTKEELRDAIKECMEEIDKVRRFHVTYNGGPYEVRDRTQNGCTVAFSYSKSIAERIADMLTDTK